MQYGEINCVNKKISRLILGTAMPPAFLEKDGHQLFDDVFALGINTFDLARNYMQSEKCLGAWMESRNNRDQIVIISKCAHPDQFSQNRVSELEILKDFSISASQLKTNYIDIYLLHRDDKEKDVSVAVEVMNKLYAEGKIGAFGASNWTHFRIEQANEYAYKHNLVPFTVSSPNFGLANQLQDPWGGGCVSISGSQNQDAREWYRKYQMPVIAYSPLGRGLFSGKFRSNDLQQSKTTLDSVAMLGYGYPENYERLRRCEFLAQKHTCSVAQISLAWIFKQDLNAYAVVSTQNKVRMEKNIQSLQLVLSESEARYLNLEQETI